ncbi:hypothetical protein J6590_040631 [Homalodisca vitripennis]|nr:hypothetical protein J6590_040631 [Homalodisca vitripennis]
MKSASPAPQRYATPAHTPPPVPPPTCAPSVTLPWHGSNVYFKGSSACRHLNESDSEELSSSITTSCYISYPILLPARRFGLNGIEVEAALPRIDTSRTEIGSYCPQFLRRPRKCRPQRYRRHDGLCNNLDHPTWGAARTPFRRLVPPEYQDVKKEKKSSKTASVRDTTR